MSPIGMDPHIIQGPHILKYIPLFIDPGNEDMVADHAADALIDHLPLGIIADFNFIGLKISDGVGNAGHRDAATLQPHLGDAHTVSPASL